MKRLLEELKTLNDNFSRVLFEKETMIEVTVLLRKRVSDLESNNLVLLDNLSDLRVAASKTDAYHCHAMQVANATMDKMKINFFSSQMQVMSLMHQNEELRWQNMTK